ncbi:MAG: hypothetical protein OES34_09745 [Nitrosopumilus sp.]|nr:hypothetical protein [Nitrosopumilus sp.]
MLIPQLIERQRDNIETEFATYMSDVYPADVMTSCERHAFRQAYMVGMLAMMGLLTGIAKEYGQAVEGDLLFRATAHAINGIMESFAENDPA